MMGIGARVVTGPLSFLQDGVVSVSLKFDKAFTTTKTKNDSNMQRNPHVGVRCNVPPQNYKGKFFW